MSFNPYPNQADRVTTIGFSFAELQESQTSGYISKAVEVLKRARAVPAESRDFPNYLGKSTVAFDNIESVKDLLNAFKALERSPAIDDVVERTGRVYLNAMFGGDFSVASDQYNRFVSDRTNGFLINDPEGKRVFMLSHRQVTEGGSYLQGEDYEQFQSHLAICSRNESRFRHLLNGTEYPAKVLSSSLEILGSNNPFTENPKVEEYGQEFTLIFPRDAFDIWCHSRNLGVDILNDVFREYMKAYFEMLTCLKEYVRHKIEMVKILGYPSKQSYDYELRVQNDPWHVLEILEKTKSVFDRIKRDIKNGILFKRQQQFQGTDLSIDNIFSLEVDDFYTKNISELNQADQYSPEYMTADAVLNFFFGLFKHSNYFFQLATDESPTWDSDVKIYKFICRSTNEIVGEIHIDFTRRDGKTAEVERLPVRRGHLTAEGRTAKPVVILKANFGKFETERGRMVNPIHFVQAVTLAGQLGLAFGDLLSKGKFRATTGPDSLIDFSQVLKHTFEALMFDETILAMIFSDGDLSLNGQPAPRHHLDELVRTYRISLIGQLSHYCDLSLLRHSLTAVGSGREQYFDRHMYISLDLEFHRNFNDFIRSWPQLTSDLVALFYDENNMLYTEITERTYGYNLAVSLKGRYIKDDPNVITELIENIFPMNAADQNILTKVKNSIGRRDLTAGFFQALGQ
ncbi:hypothetical protein H4219_003803 [Mycoemilia scoparia]|uniref:Peptidase M3A/M3B catalytic domain-containing protein n=1 Tax=Mycoemilia scoparia TaxID=417184 RepID=A0A9W7ZTP7_9FUNG|nr:hypothetical protein H4219_003803 [Mycoemilia scoparia]